MRTRIVIDEEYYSLSFVEWCYFLYEYARTGKPPILPEADHYQDDEVHDKVQELTISSCYLEDSSILTYLYKIMNKHGVVKFEQLKVFESSRRSASALEALKRLAKTTTFA